MAWQVQLSLATVTGKFNIKAQEHPMFVEYLASTIGTWVLIPHCIHLDSNSTVDWHKSR